MARGKAEKQPFQMHLSLHQHLFSVQRYSSNTGQVQNMSTLLEVTVHALGCGQPSMLSILDQIHSVVVQLPLPDVWMVIGDFNAILRADERSSSIASVSSHPSQHFLPSMGANDLWLLKGCVNICSEYTHKHYHSGITSIINHAAVHTNGFFAMDIQSLLDLLAVQITASLKFH